MPDVRGSLGQQRAGFIHLDGASLVGLYWRCSLPLPRSYTKRPIIRRFVDSERKMRTSGSVFVFDEIESEILRWIDVFFWSPSRILGNFLLYRETDKRGAGRRGTRLDTDTNDNDFIAEGQLLRRPKIDNATTMCVDKNKERTLVGSLTNSYKFKLDDGFMKKGELPFSKDNSGLTMNLDFFPTVGDVSSM
jgi:Gti1/Pac2 family transcription factor